MNAHCSNPDAWAEGRGREETPGCMLVSWTTKGSWESEWALFSGKLERVGTVPWTPSNKELSVLLKCRGILFPT